MDNFGNEKHVHLNQLKPIEVRNEYPIQSTEFVQSNTNNDEYVSFDEFGNDQFENDQNDIIDHGWCNIDTSNILPTRTRNS